MTDSTTLANASRFSHGETASFVSWCERGTPISSNHLSISHTVGIIGFETGEAGNRCAGDRTMSDAVRFSK